MSEFWNTMDSTAKTVLVTTTVLVLTGITGFVWFMLHKSNSKSKSK